MSYTIDSINTDILIKSMTSAKNSAGSDCHSFRINTDNKINTNKNSKEMEKKEMKKAIRKGRTYCNMVLYLSRCLKTPAIPLQLDLTIARVLTAMRKFKIIKSRTHSILNLILRVQEIIIAANRLLSIMIITIIEVITLRFSHRLRFYR